MICSVTVTLNPDLELLGRQVRSLRSQVDQIIIIDNGSAQSWICSQADCVDTTRFEIHRLGMNLGLAYAQNVGIRKALSLGATAVLLLDQDSMPEPGMVQRLQRELNDGEKVAAVGPIRSDRRTGTQSHFVVDGNWWPRRWRPAARESLLNSSEVGILIASGSLISCRALTDCGLMREDLFIDHVDTEWCLRVRSQGWSLRGVPLARMVHSVGDSVTRLWILGWREVALHTPVRSYFVNRNSVRLLACKFIPVRWKAFIMLRTLILDAYLLIVAPRRTQRCKMIIAGLSHGLGRRGGSGRELDR
jgi:rhamnosyltransferase